MSNLVEKQKNKLIEILKEMPSVSSACSKVGIARSTYYRWLKEDAEFRDSAEDSLMVGKEKVNDMAESVLIKNIQAGDLRATMYWLNNNSKHYAMPNKIIREVHKIEKYQPSVALVEFVGTTDIRNDDKSKN